MLSIMDKFTIIQSRLQGKSYRQISKEHHVDRRTVKRYWEDYCLNQQKLLNDSTLSTFEKDEIVRNLIESPKYDSSSRSKKKYTPEIDDLVTTLLEEEKQKDKLLGKAHKQSLTDKAIHEIVLEHGFKISYRCLSLHLKNKRDKVKEAFIRQSYELGQRCEYDFGEIRLVINGEMRKYYLAVFTAPASGFRWAYLYTNQKKEAFLDSHVQFFDMIGGVYQEVVYDNMKNVVKEFIGHTEKILNQDLIYLSSYYGFIANTTNCFSGHEKGSVERSVEVIRKQAYSKQYRFESLERAKEHLVMTLSKMNAASLIKQEQHHLLSYKPKFELAHYQMASVDKYSCISYKNNRYSVPEYLVGKKVSLKIYHDTISIYANNAFVCEHKKEDGKEKYILKIEHYLDTFLKKPQALVNSQVLKSIPTLHHIFQKHFISKPKDFIELLRQHQHVNLDQLIDMFEIHAQTGLADTSVQPSNSIEQKTRTQLHQINSIYNIKGEKDRVH